MGVQGVDQGGAVVLVQLGPLMRLEAAAQPLRDARPGLALAQQGAGVTGVEMQAVRAPVLA